MSKNQEQHGLIIDPLSPQIRVGMVSAAADPVGNLVCAQIGPNRRSSISDTRSCNGAVGRYFILRNREPGFWSVDELDIDITGK